MNKLDYEYERLFSHYEYLGEQAKLIRFGGDKKTAEIIEERRKGLAKLLNNLLIFSFKYLELNNQQNIQEDK